MNAGADGAKDMSAIELARREKIQRGGEETDPRSTTDRIEKENAGRRAGVNDPREKAKKQRHAENNVRVRGVNDAGSDLGMKDAKDESGQGKDEADQGAGSADIEEGARGANRRTNHDESAERADERWERNKKWIARMNVMVAAGEEVAEFMGEKNDEQCGGKRQASEKASGILVKKSEGAKKVIERDGLIVSIRNGELRAGG